jgi:hypothetical protein
LLDAATYCNQLESLKVAISAVAEALEGLLNAQTGGAYTVGYIDDAREFFEFPEQLLGD